MAIEIQVPHLGESITEATVSAWLKQQGDAVEDGEVLVELETDKVMVEVPAPQAGVLQAIVKGEGEKVVIGEVLGRLDADGAAAPTAADAPKAANAPKVANAPTAEPASAASAAATSRAASAPASVGNGPAAATASPSAAAAAPLPPPAAGASAANTVLPPAARRMVEQHGLDPAAIPGTGRRNQVTKSDVVAYMAEGAARAPGPAPTEVPASPGKAPPPMTPEIAPASGERTEQRVRMSRLRQRIAERLLQAQSTAAILTTFNEVDMSAAMALRAKYRDQFREKYGVALGFMSLFTKASIEALRAFPAVNGEIEGEEIVYKHYYDIGVAVGTERGLVVPVVRDADRLRFIEIELKIGELAAKARENRLGLDELTGGTFTISNGGIYGSMLSTPILNPPQSGILGLHNITKRPVVVADQVVVRPMMYVALSYDHRIIDGREAVQFLVRVKECVEDPARMLLEI